MKRFLSVLAIAALFALASCSGDDGGNSGTSESTAIKGTPGSFGIDATGSFTGGSAFYYSSRGMVNFLLCEGDAKNWNDALKKPHLEIHILQGLILKDVSQVSASNYIDVNDPSYANVECPVSVRWAPGNGMTFVNKYSYTGAANMYKFDTGSLSVAKGPMSGMYTIAFLGNGKDKDNKTWDANWGYGGQFTHK